MRKKRDAAFCDRMRQPFHGDGGCAEGSGHSPGDHGGDEPVHPGIYPGVRGMGSPRKREALICKKQREKQSAEE